MLSYSAVKLLEHGWLGDGGMGDGKGRDGMGGAEEQKRTCAFGFVDLAMWGFKIYHMFLLMPVLILWS